MALDKQHKVRRAYYSAVSHADDQVGRVVDGLKALGVWNSTSLGNSVGWNSSTTYKYFWDGSVLKGSIVCSLSLKYYLFEYKYFWDGSVLKGSVVLLYVVSLVIVFTD